MINKKGESNTGLVLGLVFGIASLIIVVMIAFTITGIMGGSSIIPQTNYQLTNESQSSIATLVNANQSGYNVQGRSLVRNPGAFILTSCYAEYFQSNGTATTVTTWGGYNRSLTSANCTLSSAGNLSSGTPATYNFPNVSISYTYKGDNAQILTSDNLTSNFSSGAQNISSKIPTILLIAAVILIIGILAVLVGVWYKMRMGGGSL